MLQNAKTVNQTENGNIWFHLEKHKSTG